MMRNIVRYGLGVFAAVLLAGCSYDGEDTAVAGLEPGGESGGSYSFSINAGQGSTRAELGTDGIFRWSPLDEVGFYMVPAGTSAPSASNVKLKNVNLSPSASADFDGEMKEWQMPHSNAGKYDYYSYYPYTEDTGSTFPYVKVTLPATRTVRPNELDPNAVMVADKVSYREPVTWLDANGVQRFGEKAGFSYSHVFSYAKIFLACNLMSPQRITQMKITDNGGAALSGDCSVDITTGDYTMSNTSSSVTINIEGGFDITDGYIYVPMPVADLSSHTFTIELTTDQGASVTMTLNKGVDFQRAQVHKLGLLVPFYVDFTQGVTQSSSSFISCGHTITSNSKVSINNDGGNTSLQLALKLADSDRGCIKLPFLNYNTHPDYTPASRYARIAIDASGPQSASVDSYRQMRFAAVGAGNYNLSSTPYFQMQENLTGYGWRVFDEANGDAKNGSRYNIQLGDGVYVTFHPVSGTVGYNNWIRKIWVYPNFEYVP